METSYTSSPGPGFVRQLRLEIIVAFGFIMAAVQAYASALNDKAIENTTGVVQQIVSGRVMNSDGELLEGVSVVEKETNNWAQTDGKGAFTIELTTADPVLQFLLLGYKKKEVSITDEKVIEVVLADDVESLDEIVVVGFGTQKKASVVGAITNVETSELQSTPSRSLSNNLAGRVSGIIAVQRSGDPWFSNSDFWIRGISTFTGNTNPLVLVDGIERSLHDIDPAEIESFSVLKDAAASAVYGVRGANGVIMINTKRGKIGKPRIDVRFERAYTEPLKIPEYVGSVKYLQLMNELYEEAGKPPLVSEATLLNYKNQTDPELYPDVNWWKEITRDRAESNRINLNVNGGTDILRYNMTLSGFSENGIIDRDAEQDWDSSLKVKRYSVRSNVDVNITPSTLLRVNLGGFLQTRNSPPFGDDTNSTLFYHAMRIPPYVHPKIYSGGEIPRISFRENPWAFATQRGYAKMNLFKLESLTSLEQDLDFIVEGLKGKFSFSFDKFSSNWVRRAKTPDYYNPATTRDEDGNLILTIQHHGEQFLGYEKGSDWGDQSVYLEGQLSYNRQFNDVHDINAMVLYNQRDYDNGDRLPYRNQGVAGRFSYTFDRRYVAEFNFGYNGSENFARGKRFGFFPAVAAGWIISEEKFMQPLSDVITNLKFRLSWGEAGNSILGSRRFAYISTIVDTGSYRWGTDNNVYRLGRAEGEIGVPNLTWETVTKKNFGMELNLFNNSINYVVDVFREDRKDIFMERKNVPGSTGFNRNIWANFGKVQNQGVDMSLSINRQITKDWYLSFYGNYTYANNKVVEIDEPLSIIGTYRSQTGKPVGQLFGLIAEGLFTDDDFDANGDLKPGIPEQKFTETIRPGDIKYRDLNDDGEVSYLDRTAIGNPRVPKVVYGFGMNTRVKSFDLGFFFQGVGKTSQILGGENWLPGSALGATGSIFTNIDDRWTPDNPGQDVFWPRLTYGANSNNEQQSTWWLRDMSFLRLKSAEIGYSFNERWLKKIAVKNLRVFVRGSNLLTFSKFKLWDPELETTDGLRYPQMRTISFGLNMNFN